MDYEDYYRSQGLVPNAEGTEWVKPSWVEDTPSPLQNPDVTPADIAAYRTRRSVKGKRKLPVEDDRSLAADFFSGPANPERPSYVMEPNLEETQGGMQLPPSITQDAGGSLVYADTGEPVPVVRRPGLLPIANTPEGLKFAAPKLLDIVGNVMGNVAGPAVAVKAGEKVLGSGVTKTTSPQIRMVPVDYDPFATDWYHGSVRIDRMEGKIDPRRATSGPMPYFTDNPEMASSYAQGKKPDTSLQMHDPGDNVANYFTVSPKELGYTRSRTPYTVEQSWYHLSSEKKKEILDKYHRIGYENRYTAEGPYTLHNEPYSGLSGKDHYDYILKNEAQGNPLKALRIIWHDDGSLINQESDLADIYKLAGYPHKISEATAPWTEARGVMATKLNIKNPLITDQHDIIEKQIVPELEKIFKNDRSRKPDYSPTDMWDKNYRFTPKEWVSQLKEDLAAKKNSYVWTSIPDKVTNALKQLGFDGILDTGNKGGGGLDHTVAIPFDIPGIVKSKYSGKTLFSDTRNQVASQVAHQVEKNGFYSALQGAVSNAKIEKGDAQQWLGYLKNQPGVKQEEINYVLKDLPKGQITKGQLEDIVKQNKVQLEEKVLGEEQAKENVKDWYERKRSQNLNPENTIPWERLNQNERQYWLKEQEKEIKLPTQYHSYQLPGGENYKEMLLKLPEKSNFDPSKVEIKRDRRSVTQGSVELFYDGKRLERYNDDIKLRDGEYQGLPDSYWKDIIKNHFVDNGDNFKAPHFDKEGTNLLAHIRMNDRSIPVDFTEAEKAALQAHNEAAPYLEKLKQSQADVGKAIRETAKSLNDAKRKEILANQQIPEKRLSVSELNKALESFWEHPELKPLQDKLAKLRQEEDNVRKALPSKPEQKFKKVLHVEEVQSDLHQKGRDQGYKGEKEKLQPAFDKIEEKIVGSNDEEVMGQPKVKDALKLAVEKKIITPEEAKVYQRYTDIENGQPVPDLPFKTSWEDLALKRIIRHAAENGHEGISWEHGEAQALRYQNDIRQKIDKIDWEPRSTDVEPNNPQTRVYIKPSGGGEIALTLDKNGNVIAGKNELKDKRLDEVVGKDLAKQILEKPKGTIDAKGYVMGAEGMKAAYDTRMVNKMNELGKKYGAKVEERRIPSEPHVSSIEEYARRIGLPVNSETVQREYPKSVAMHSKPIHYFPITPALREKAMKEGFPLFSSTSPTLIPVDHQPEFDNKKKIKLVPVEGNPFQ